ncbi:MAG: protein kinase [Bifidobacterium sp.]|nr:protein kinase [Bifidobacterium sp.]
MCYTPGKLHRVGEHVREDITDYRRLCELGVRVPAMLDVDIENERILKESVSGPTVLELVMTGQMQDTYLDQVRAAADRLTRKHIGIDWFPANFVVHDEKLYYVDYQCDDYDESRDFEHVGMPYWTKGQLLEDYVKAHPVICATV